MGSFADYQGNNNIPEEKRFLFASQMCRILSLGGMMRTGEVKMFGHTITLLRPIPQITEGKFHFYYNYFEDRLYWWDGTDEVRVTEETDKWLKNLALQHKKLMGNIVISTESITALQDFLELLAEIDTYYWRILPFESMFYDFVGHISQKEYAAAIELIRAISDDEQNRKSGAIIIKRKNMESESKNIIENDGRIQIKRLFSVMANKQLRKIYFDF